MGILSASDILRGGDKGVKSITLKSVTKDGEPGVINHLPISAATMIGFQAQVSEAQRIEKEGGNPHHIENMVKMLADHLCNPDGSKMFSEQDLMSAPADVLVEIMQAITDVGARNDDSGNASSGAASPATGSASPTDSQAM